MWLQVCGMLSASRYNWRTEDFTAAVPPNGIWHTSPIAQQMGLPAARAVAAPEDSKKAMRDCSAFVSIGTEVATPLVA